ncbi:hypothetical protein ACJX0J_027243, partial [Zea mays]
TPPIFYLTFIVPMFLGDRATKAAKKVSVVGFDIDVSFCFFLVLSIASESSNNNYKGLRASANIYKHNNEPNTASMIGFMHLCIQHLKTRQISSRIYMNIYATKNHWTLKPDYQNHLGFYQHTTKYCLPQVTVKRYHAVVGDGIRYFMFLEAF